MLASTSTSPAMLLGAPPPHRGAVLAVLTQPVLWRTMTAFMAGWPFPLYRFWKQRIPTYTLHSPWRDGYHAPLEFPQKRGAVLHVAIIEDNLEILQLAYEQSKFTEVGSTASSLLDVCHVITCAARFGRLAILRWLIARQKQDTGTSAVWASKCDDAMESAFSRRDFSVMDLLFESCPREHTPIPYDELKRAVWNDDLVLVKWAYDRGYDFHDQGNYRTKHAMDHAASLAMLQLLNDGTRNDIGCSERVVDKAGALGDLSMLRFLHERRFTSYNDSAMRFAVRNGRLDIVRFLHEERGMEWCALQDMDAAAASGHLDIVEYLHANRTEGCTTGAMDGAAASGHLEIVQFLHERRREGCTTSAMDGAAKGGHLAIVKFLHEHRSEGCTRNAMDGAAANGHLEIVRFLHEHRSEGCTIAALHSAVVNSHVDVALFLGEHRPEGGTPASTAIAAQRGWCDVVEVLLTHHRGKRGACTKAAMDGAASAGHADIVALLHERSDVGCTTKAMDSAAAKGHIAIVQFLHANRTEGCTSRALDSAAANGHLAVVQFLIEHRSEGCASEALEAAIARGHDDVAAFLRRVVHGTEEDHDDDSSSASSALWQK